MSIYTGIKLRLEIHSKFKPLRLYIPKFFEYLSFRSASLTLKEQNLTFYYIILYCTCIYYLQQSNFRHFQNKHVWGCHSCTKSAHPAGKLYKVLTSESRIILKE